MAKKTLPVVAFSGGLGSAFVACLIKRQGIDPVLLCTDTNFESPDTYVFMDSVASFLNLKITYVSDGRTPEQVFWDEHLLGNDLFPICSVRLKANQCEQWIMEQRIHRLGPVMHVGILPGEPRRVSRIRKQYEHMATYPVEVIFPLVDPDMHGLTSREAKQLLSEGKTYIERIDHADQAHNNKVLADWFEERGIKTPDAYKKGFLHNNCRNQCVRAGMGHYYNAYQRDRTAFNESRDREYRFCIEVYPKTKKGNGNPAIDTRGFPTVTYLKRHGKPFSLAEMEAMIEQGWKPGVRDWNPKEDLRPCMCLSD